MHHLLLFQTFTNLMLCQPWMFYYLPPGIVNFMMYDVGVMSCPGALW